MPRIKLTAKERELSRNLKAQNRRLATLYEESKKSGDFTLYDEVAKKLNASEIKQSGLVHKSEKGALQVKQGASNYRSDIGKVVADIMKTVPTITQLKERAKKKLGEMVEKAKDWFQRLSAYTKVNEEKANAYDQLYDYVRQHFTERESYEIMKQTYDRAEDKTNANELLRIVKDLEREREDEWKQVTGGELPFTDSI